MPDWLRENPYGALLLLAFAAAALISFAVYRKRVPSVAGLRRRAKGPSSVSVRGPYWTQRGGGNRTMALDVTNLSLGTADFQVMLEYPHPPQDGQSRTAAGERHENQPLEPDPPQDPLPPLQEGERRHYVLKDLPASWAEVAGKAGIHLVVTAKGREWHRSAPEEVRPFLLAFQAGGR